MSGSTSMLWTLPLTLSDNLWLKSACLPSRCPQFARSGGPLGRRPIALGQAQAVVLERGLTVALAGRRCDRVEHRGRGHEDSRFADAAPESARRHDDRLDLRHVADAHRIVSVEVGLLD